MKAPNQKRHIYIFQRRNINEAKKKISQADYFRSSASLGLTGKKS